MALNRKRWRNRFEGKDDELGFELKLEGSLSLPSGDVQ